MDEIVGSCYFEMCLFITFVPVREYNYRSNLATQMFR